MTMTKEQLAGFIYALELAADDQKSYVSSGCVTIDYSVDDIRTGKIPAIKQMAEAAYSIGQTALGDRFENLGDQFRMLADSAESEQAEVTL